MTPCFFQTATELAIHFANSALDWFHKTIQPRSARAFAHIPRLVEVVLAGSGPLGECLRLAFFGGFSHFSYNTRVLIASGLKCCSAAAYLRQLVAPRTKEDLTVNSLRHSTGVSSATRSILPRA